MAKTVFISGSGSQIASDLGQRFHAQGDHVITCSRSQHQAAYSASHYSLDTTTPHATSRLASWLNTQPTIDIVICCNGLLHSNTHGPEKSLQQLHKDWLHQSLDANVYSHIVVAQAVHSQVSRHHPITWVSLSAMVGSIEDNALGGWYSYRMTKAALNMFIKNLSIEWGRKCSRACVVAIHPGTTQTPLSAPFQASIKPEKLYSSQQTAHRLYSVINTLSAQQHGRLLHWDGTILPF